MDLPSCLDRRANEVAIDLGTANTLIEVATGSMLEQAPPAPAADTSDRGACSPAVVRC